MSMASPTLRSSSRTLPELSWRSWATDMEALPSTAEIDTGTSKTGARSVAFFSSPSKPPSAGSSPPGPNSSSWSSLSDMALYSSGEARVGPGNQGFGVQALGGERRVQGLGDAVGGGLRVVGRRPVAEIEGEGAAGEAALR